jgi:hypothetical protein
MLLIISDRDSVPEGTMLKNLLNQLLLVLERAESLSPLIDGLSNKKRVS